MAISIRWMNDSWLEIEPGSDLRWAVACDVPTLSPDCCGPDEESGEGIGDEASVARIARSFDRQARDLPDTDALPEPSHISLRLLEMLGDVAEARPTLLDLGCGTGGAAIRMAQRGARHVTGIDLSPASIEVARRRVATADVNQTLVSFEVADVASAPLQTHDWVLLDRVICCYRDAEGLLANALSAADRRLAFTVPESRGWRGILNTVGWGVENAWKRIVRQQSCPGYVHDVNAIEQNLNDAGFRITRHGRRGLWYAAVFDR
jgi:magnesium-protoporphyrin O-methyltransferase